MLGKPLLALFRAYHIHDRFIDGQSWDPDRRLPSISIKAGAFSLGNSQKYDQSIWQTLYTGLGPSMTDINWSWRVP